MASDEARLLLACTVDACEDWSNDGLGADYVLALTFYGPRRVYDLLRDTGSNAHASFKNAAEALLPPEFHYATVSARAAIVAPHSADWRNELLAIL